MRFNRQLVACLTLLSGHCFAQQFNTVPLPDFNARLQAQLGASWQYPTGNVVLGSVPFFIKPDGNNMFSMEAMGGPNPRVFNIPVNEQRVTTVFTLISTWWGARQTAGYARFYGSGGAYYEKELVGNVDVRDYLNNVFTTNINGTTTEMVASYGSGTGNQVWLDRQRFDLPNAFKNETLVRMELVDVGAGGIQRMYISAVTVARLYGGDTDESGCVDDADLTNMILDFGGPGGAGSGFPGTDVNLDGVVDDADLTDLILNFGSGC